MMFLSFKLVSVQYRSFVLFLSPEITHGLQSHSFILFLSPEITHGLQSLSFILFLSPKIIQGLHSSSLIKFVDCVIFHCELIFLILAISTLVKSLVFLGMSYYMDMIV